MLKFGFYVKENVLFGESIGCRNIESRWRSVPDLRKEGKRTVKHQMQALAFLCVLLFFPLRAVDYRNIYESISDSTDAGTTKSLETGGMEEGEMGAEDDRPGPAVAITFDDGPNAASTPALLDGLKERGVKATFFVIGKNIEKEGNREIIERMYKEGHQVGNHTYSHANLSQMSREEAHEELNRTDALVREITGAETEFVRPPFGAFPEDMEEELDKLYVKWTVDPLDWTTENADEIVQRVVTETKENDIILLHDCYESSVEAALRIIDILQEEGYEFVTVDRLLID